MLLLLVSLSGLQVSASLASGNKLIDASLGEGHHIPSRSRNAPAPSCNVPVQGLVCLVCGRLLSPSSVCLYSQSSVSCVSFTNIHILVMSTMQPCISIVVYGVYFIPSALSVQLLCLSQSVIYVCKLVLVNLGLGTY